MVSCATVTEPTFAATRLQRWPLIAAVAVVFVLTWLAAAWKPLGYDELFTYYVARQPSPQAVVHALLTGADTNPPLDPLLRHASMALFGESPVAFRLPSVLAFIAGLLAIHAYVWPRVPVAAALAALLAPAGTAAMSFACEGRAHALLFASGALALIAWQRAIAAPTARRLMLLSLALGVGPLSHFFGVLSLLPPLIGEAWRAVIRRRLDRRIAAAWLGGALLSLGALPFARPALGLQGAVEAGRGRLAAPSGFALDLLQHAGSPVLLVLGAGALLVGALALGPRTRAALRLELPSHELVAAAALACVPLYACLAVPAFAGGTADALTAADLVACVPGVAILLCYLVALVAKSLPRTAWMATGGLAAIALTSHVWTLGDFLKQEPFPTPLRQAIELSSLPVAFDSPRTFLEYRFHAPELARDRFVYPMDAGLARRLRSSDEGEIALRGLARIEPLDLRGYVEFASRTPEFLLVRDYRYPPALARQLPADGFCLDELLQTGSVVLLHVTWGCDG